MTEFLATSGARVKINLAPWGVTVALKSAIAQEICKTNMDLNVNIFSGLQNDINLIDFVKLALIVDSSELVYQRLFDCLIKCSYNGDKITPETFEDAKARQDYYDIVIACLKENIFPFFEGQISKLRPFLARLNQMRPPEKTPE